MCLLVSSFQTSPPPEEHYKDFIWWFVFFLRKQKALHNPPISVTGAPRCLFITNPGSGYCGGCTSHGKRRGTGGLKRGGSRSQAAHRRHRVGNTQLLITAGRQPQAAAPPSLPLAQAFNASSSKNRRVPGPSRRPPSPPQPCGSTPPSPQRDGQRLPPLPPLRVAAQPAPRLGRGAEGERAGERAWRSPLTGPHMFTGPRSAGMEEEGRNLRQKPNRIAGGSMEGGLWELGGASRHRRAVWKQRPVSLGSSSV